MSPANDLQQHEREPAGGAPMRDAPEAGQGDERETRRARLLAAIWSAIDGE